MRPLRRLVLGEILGRVDLAEARVLGHELLRRLDAEVEGEDGAEPGDLHLPEAGKRADPLPEVGAVRGLRPDPLGLAAVLVHDDLAELLHSLRHRTREAVDGRRRPERSLQGRGVHLRDRPGVEGADPLSQLERAGERLLDRDLLVDGEADEERDGLVRDEPVRLVRIGEVQRLGHTSILDARSRIYDRAVQELRVEHEGVILAGSYSPAGETAVVALHGAGEGTREGLLYEHLHEVLPPAGIGVVTFDRRGEGESTGDASRGRFAVQVRDALAMIDAVDVRRVGLWGYSQGGWIGPLAATASERVAFLVLVASTGVTPSEQMIYATARQLELAGYDAAVVSRALDLRRRFEDWVHGVGRERDAELRADLLSALDEPWFGQLFLPPVLLDEEGCRLWIEEMDFDPRPVFVQVRVPTLLFYGAADSWSPVEPSVEAWRAARGDAVEIVVIPDAEHDLTLAEGALAPEYERTLVDWLARRSRA